LSCTDYEENVTVLITTDQIDPLQAYAMIAKKSSGSLLFHYAVVKEKEGLDGVTCYIDYSLVGDGEGELRTIAGEIAASWNIEDLLLVRRTGRVGVGEIISLVAVSSPSSEDAFAACKSGLEQLKKMRCIVKDEVCG
jgi:molybdopterin synthase catalytic subunit